MKPLSIALGLCLSGAVMAGDGEVVYNQYCVACHGTGVGPMAHDQAAWQPRLDAKGGVEGLLESAKAGVNAMPPKGGCVDCSDEQLRDAIVFMTTSK
ncbi:cytochrome c5 family protein [Motiliproteus sp. SC1-56]|uniref:c-type cytochrome n=1 Tax=Motiliproteus sp. SC1-56 TaxID=2799565 RepID=UPI001A901884|nr:c-type cytochrome [Motiliproteus sp. SC1-56]